MRERVQSGAGEIAVNVRRLVPPVLLLFAVGSGCTPPERGDTGFVPDFTVNTGVEVATVLGVDPGSPMTLYSATGERLLTVLADDYGQAHFSYVPAEYQVVDSRDGLRFPLADGSVLEPGPYFIRNDETGESSGTIHVHCIDQVPPDWFYEDQTLQGIPWNPLSGPEGDPEDGYQYIEMRDGILLGAMVRFPDPTIYGEGPYPTVIEYSGYSPSRPDNPDNGTEIANALGFATVSVNMRGSGCSGGVYDVFNPAQHADGYDVVEIVAHQDWVLHHQVGMVGLSYPGISQLYVASTDPPDLAAIVPLSTIADGWEMQWPGGIYNAGFTRQWVDERESQSAAGGTSWVTQRIDDGDTVCEDNVRLHQQSIDFETFFHGLQYRPPASDERDLDLLVQKIQAPVYLGGAFQDEQTGAQFGRMIDKFRDSSDARFLLQNGRHPDGYAPDIVFDWYEFLEFYVAERIPKLNPAFRALAGQQFGAAFGLQHYTFPLDRFTDYGDDYPGALAAYEAEPRVTVRFEQGYGGDVIGSPLARFQTTYDTWPTPEADPVEWYPEASGTLSDTAPSAAGGDAWTFDPDAGSDTFFGPRGYRLLDPIWDIDWKPFAHGDVATYETAPFPTSRVIAGPGIATLWVKSPVDDVTVQVTLTEVRPDGKELLVQSGWLRLGHRAATEVDGLRLQRSFSKADFSPVPVDQWVKAEVQIPSVAHPFRAGSRLRMQVSSPGRNQGTWEFEAPDYDGTPTFELGRGGEHASSLRMTILPDIDIPDGYPPCPSLRGQPCRDDAPVDNVVIE